MRLILLVKIKSRTEEIKMPEIVLDLGSVTIPDNTVESGLLTQQDMQDWLDEQFDQEGSGSNYQARMTTAIRTIGIRGVSNRVSQHKASKARQAITPQTGIISESQ